MNAVDFLKKSDPTLRFGGNLSVIAFSTALKSFGNGFINSYVALYFVELGGNAFSFGLIAALSSLIVCLAFIAGGLIADYYGRRKIMFIAAFYGAFSVLLFRVIHDWKLFSLAYVVATFASISGPASLATIADSLSQKNVPQE